ncbi:hypothetical protein [Janthinobacterium sp. B9-8]|uniref:hypothetical protein n=1 Tax=Janthinobacterium sp. B9-8 TaxID=1236179 RepID=UPI00069A160E|nr:hypothetical protein [Janthinobacterium sp. B9-8]AMC35361.1 hypothetical protein VN23_12440 [Janthinobacterium sp. B9-8]
MTNHNEHWEHFLDPEVVRPSLFMAAMFITVFEILKNSIVDRLRDFYLIGLSDESNTVCPDYTNNVLSRNKSAVYASLSWLVENEAINDSDIATFEQLKSTRNLLAHKLFDVVTGQAESTHQEQFTALVELLRKIEVWWVVNVELATNPDYDDQEIDEAEIVPGAILSLQMLLHVASGGTDLLDEWRNLQAKRSPPHAK